MTLEYIARPGPAGVALGGRNSRSDWPYVSGEQSEIHTVTVSCSPAPCIVSQVPRFPSEPSRLICRLGRSAAGDWRDLRIISTNQRRPVSRNPVNVIHGAAAGAELQIGGSTSTNRPLLMLPSRFSLFSSAGYRMRSKARKQTPMEARG
jgi:hypothetical protein